MVPERVFDAERSIISGNPIGLELHWWLAEDSRADIARVLAPYDQPTEYLTDDLRDRLRQSGIRAVAVPISELFVVHQIAKPRSAWQRQWLGQETRWIQLFNARKVPAGIRSAMYSGEQRLPEGILRMLGRGWMQPSTVVRDGQRSIEPVMFIELAVQIVEPRRPTPQTNRILIPTADFNTPEETRGPFLDDAAVRLVLPRGYALVLTTDSPDSEWGGSDVVTRDNLIEELLRREQRTTADPLDPATPTPSTRFGPTPQSVDDEDPTANPAGGSVDPQSIFQTLDAPMPSLAAAFGPPSAQIPTLGQLLMETQDGMGRPLRAVVILVPRVPERFSILP